jgi:nucleotide-binding universal stress UspA family protein
MRTPRRILVPFDNSELSLDALDYARVLARGFRGTVTVFLALGDEPATGEVGIAEHRRQDAERMLEDAIANVKDGPPIPIARVVRWGDAPREISKIAAEIDADVIVMGTHGRKGLARTFLGSVTETVLRTSTRPVLTLRGPAKEHLCLPKHLLVATDFGPHSARALHYAVDLAALLGASVTVATVLATPLPVLTGETSLINAEVLDQLVVDTTSALEAATASLRDRGVPIRTELREGEAPRAVNALAVELAVDLIVLGTRGRHGMAHAVLGSVAEQILRDAVVPVLTVRARA